MGSLRVNNQVVLGEELVCHLNGCTQVASGVAAQVNDEFLHALAAQVGQAGQHFGKSGLAELVDHNIADALLG